MCIANSTKRTAELIETHAKIYCILTVKPCCKKDIKKVAYLIFHALYWKVVHEADKGTLNMLSQVTVLSKTANINLFVKIVLFAFGSRNCDWL